MLLNGGGGRASVTSIHKFHNYGIATVTRPNSRSVTHRQFSLENQTARPAFLERVISTSVSWARVCARARAKAIRLVFISIDYRKVTEYVSPRAYGQFRN